MKKIDPIDRYEQLQEIAIGRFLDRSDFVAEDWLTNEEKIEYAALYQEVHGECMQCGSETGTEHDIDCEFDTQAIAEIKKQSKEDREQDAYNAGMQ